jgi:hypothetical protein
MKGYSELAQWVPPGQWIFANNHEKKKTQEQKTIIVPWMLVKCWSRVKIYSMHRINLYWWKNVRCIK